MSEPARKKPRITEDLQTLGRIIHKPNTPKQRTPSGRDKDKENAAVLASAGANRIFVRTPGSAAVTPTTRTPTARTPSASARTRKVGSARRAAPTTPHAIRAQQQRRNVVMASGGNRRRRSGLMQRATPRDDLRALSRLLAKKSKPTATPKEATPRRRRSSLVDQEDSPAIDRPPRLSLNPADLEDDSWHEQPPRLSYPLDDEEDEIEQRRRAALSRRRSSLPSYIDPSVLDNGPGNLDALDDETRQKLLDQDISIRMDGLDELDDNHTAELRAMLEARGGGESGLEGEGMTEITDGEPTFLFKIPERSRLSLAPDIPRTPQGPDAEDDGFEDVVEDEEEAVGGAEADGESDGEDDDNIQAHSNERFDDDLPIREDSVSPLNHEIVEEDTAPTTKTKTPHKRLPREVKVSRHGIEYPTFPPAVVKRLANTFSKSYGGGGKLSKDTLAAIQQASDWFFEQVSEDLADYASHARRKTIEESDVVMLMKRQRVLNQNTTLFSLASKYLPRELLKEVRMPVQQIKGKKRKRTAKRMDTIEEDEEE